MGTRRWLVTGAVLGGLAVVLGAFGAHLLKEQISPERLEIWETGVRYHLVHALALIVVGVLRLQYDGRWLDAAGYCFLLGVVIFSGLLYALALSGVSILGAIVPIGGLAMIGGWGALAVGAARIRVRGA